MSMVGGRERERGSKRTHKCIHTSMTDNSLEKKDKE
jgi:hypothetical protein